MRKVSAVTAYFDTAVVTATSSFVVVVSSHLPLCWYGNPGCSSCQLSISFRSITRCRQKDLMTTGVHGASCVSCCSMQVALKNRTIGQRVKTMVSRSETIRSRPNEDRLGDIDGAATWRMPLKRHRRWVRCPFGHFRMGSTSSMGFSY